MMIKNTRKSKHAPVIDERLRKSISLATTTEVSLDICVLMSNAFLAIADELEDDGILNDIMRIQIIVTDKEEITLELFKEEIATAISIIVYQTHKWKKHNYDEFKISSSIIEGFAHLYWNIESEIEVNEKVLKIFRRLVPTIEMTDLYSDYSIKK